MKLLVVLAVVLPLVFTALPRKVLDDPEVDMWKAWKVKYEKRYETVSEETSRFNIWKDNVEKVIQNFACWLIISKNQIFSISD